MHHRFSDRRFHGFGPRFELAYGCGSARWSRRFAEEAATRAQRYAQRRFEEDELSGGFGLGVRRPLRFLSWKLELDEEQTGRLARVLERLKLERAQAALDLRRAAAELADALEADPFGRDKVEAAGQLRAAAARRVDAAVAGALAELHALCEPDQRGRLAELIRTGVLRI